MLHFQEVVSARLARRDLYAHFVRERHAQRRVGLLQTRRRQIAREIDRRAGLTRPVLRLLRLGESRRAQGPGRQPVVPKAPAANAPADTVRNSLLFMPNSFLYNIHKIILGAYTRSRLFSQAFCSLFTASREVSCPPLSETL